MASPKKDHFNVEAYLKSLAPQESIDFFGIDVPVPVDTPLSYTLKAQEIQDSSAEDPRNVLKLLADIHGQDVADAIEERDPGIRAIGALLLWSFKNASGDETDFESAYEQYLNQEREAREKALEDSEEGEDEDEGKPKLQAVPNRSDRRAAAATGRKSARTSQRSSRTSGGNTA